MGKNSKGLVKGKMPKPMLNKADPPPGDDNSLAFLDDGVSDDAALTPEKLGLPPEVLAEFAALAARPKPVG